MRRRVVITGCGLVTPLGDEPERFFDALLEGRSAIGPLRRFTAPGVESPMGAEVSLRGVDDVLPGMDEDGVRARCDVLSLTAAERALADAGLAHHSSIRTRMGVVLGSTLASERQIADLNERRLSHADDAIDSGFVERSDNHRLAAVVARRFGLGGPAWMNATACSSGNAATAWAYDLVSSGAADVVLAGGADTLTRLIYCGFFRMGALSKTVCRPFDRSRDGVTFGEGSGFLVLESSEHAEARGVRIRAEVVGYGISNDAYHVTAPEPNGEGFARAMRAALASTGIAPDAIDYVSAHGTGTPYNDLGEMRAMTTVFGARAKDVPISSIKSMIGHTNGAASAIESIACVMAMERQALPPTANLIEPEPGFDLDYVPGKGRDARVATCLNLAAGFGGFNVCLVLRRFA